MTKKNNPLAGGFPTTPDHQTRFLNTLAALINNDVNPFQESLEGYAAAAAAASMLTDWESSDDGTGYLTAAIKRSDVQDVIELLQKWAKTLTDTPATKAPAVPILDMTPKGHYADRSPIYTFGTSFPWVRTTDAVRPTPQEAYDDAKAWVVKYQRDDPFGNMGAALGATPKDGGYVGVVNYFHSNT